MIDKPKVSTEAMDWATEQIGGDVLNSPIARNADGTPKTLRQLLAETRTALGPKP